MMKNRFFVIYCCIVNTNQVVQECKIKVLTHIVHYREFTHCLKSLASTTIKSVSAAPQLFIKWQHPKRKGSQKRNQRVVIMILVITLHILQKKDHPLWRYLSLSLFFISISISISIYFCRISMDLLKQFQILLIPNQNVVSLSQQNIYILIL